MITFFEILLLAPLVLLTMLLVSELVLGTVFFETFRSESNDEENRTHRKVDISSAILIPAHNEEDVIEDTLIRLKQHLGDRDVIVVVADNCSDETAHRCRQQDVVVLERFNDKDIGKGYALEHGRQWILNNLNVDVVVLFDADCEFVGSSFNTLIDEAVQKNKVCQACYLMKSSGKIRKTKVAEFTWWLKNAIRPLGHKALRFGTQIQGSGIVFPTSILKQTSLASGSIVEDLELGLNLAVKGHNVHYSHRSLVISFFPENEKGLEAQRTRWEHGHLATIRKLPRQILDSLIRGDVKSVLQLLDAAIPPLFSFILYQVVMVVIGIGFHWLFDTKLLLTVSLLCLGLSFAALCIVWFMHGRKILGFSAIIEIIKFLLSKFTIYTKFLTKKQSSWEKTTRDKK